MAKIEVETINTRLEGRCPIMFDHFTSQEKDTKPPEQKFYFDAEGHIVLPAENIYAFLFGENPAGCARTEGKKGKEFIRTGFANIGIKPELIPFLRDDKPLTFTGFDDKTFMVFESAPRVKSGTLSIKQNVKKRPVLLDPWVLQFRIELVKNPLINKTTLFNWFVAGGNIIGLGTYRPRYGRFTADFE